MLKHLENDSDPSAFKPAAFRRLCVETVHALPLTYDNLASRLQAAVC